MRHYGLTRCTAGEAGRIETKRPGCSGFKSECESTTISALRSGRTLAEAYPFRSAFPPPHPRHKKGALAKRGRHQYLSARRLAYRLVAVLRLDLAAIERRAEGTHLAFDLGGMMMALRIRQF